MVDKAPDGGTSALITPPAGALALTCGPAVIAPPGPPRTYLAAAEAMLAGADVLASATPLPATALSLLAAHCLECALKAYLARAGKDAHVLKLPVRHNLHALWGMAAADHLPIASQMPTWADKLAKIHGSPYQLRYFTKVHGLVLPGAQPMVAELHEVITLVRAAL